MSMGLRAHCALPLYRFMSVLRKANTEHYIASKPAESALPPGMTSTSFSMDRSDLSQEHCEMYSVSYLSICLYLVDGVGYWRSSHCLEKRNVSTILLLSEII